MVAASPEKVLREMSDRSLRHFAPRRRRVDANVDRMLLLRTSSELQAVATVLVMLDLIEEDDAEQLLGGHRRALEGFGVDPRGELTLRPTSAYGFQAARERQFESLGHRPVAFAAPGVHVSLSDCDVLVEWLAVAPNGLRGGAVIAASNGGRLPAGQLEVVIPCVDDTAGHYEFRVRAGQAGVQFTPPPWADAPATSAEITTEPSLAASAAWIELRPPGSAPVRIDLDLPQTLASGRSEPEWPSPAEWFLDALLPDLPTSEPGATFGVGLDATGALQVGGAVADALLAVGALSPGSPLLRRYPERDGRWHHELTGRYTARANRDFAVFDAVVVQDRDVWLHFYFFPEAVGEYWPVSFRPFTVQAADDLGQQHQAVPATHRWFPEHEGMGDMWLFPPLDPAVRLLRLTVSTPWEAAWTELALTVG